MRCGCGVGRWEGVRGRVERDWKAEIERERECECEKGREVEGESGSESEKERESESERRGTLGARGLEFAVRDGV